MSPAAKLARLMLIRDAWARYQSRRQHAAARRSGGWPVREKSGTAYLLEALSEENLATYADVGTPDVLSEIREAATC